MHPVRSACCQELQGNISPTSAKIRHMPMSYPVLSCVCSKPFVYSTCHWTPCTNYFLARCSQCLVQSQLSSINFVLFCFVFYTGLAAICDVDTFGLGFLLFPCKSAAISPSAELRPTVADYGCLSDVLTSLAGLSSSFSFFQKVIKTEAH